MKTRLVRAFKRLRAFCSARKNAFRSFSREWLVPLIRRMVIDHLSDWL